MMSKCFPLPAEDWPNRLEQVIASQCTLLNNVIVLRETTSTQDAAKRLNAPFGTAIVAWRQTAGRGRLGRRWSDTAEDGVALTIVLDGSQFEPEQLAIATAVGAARAAERFLDSRAGIKWPNDVMVHGRKLAGILIERTAHQSALVGVGFNVNQTYWPQELADWAVSLAQCSAPVERLSVVAELMAQIDGALQLDKDALESQFAMRDVLRGMTATFRSGERTVTGVVLRVDPMQGLMVQSESGKTWLNAATTTMLRDEPTQAVPPRSPA